MNKEISKIDNSLMELQSTQKFCEELMKSPHYKKMGAEGIFAIVETAKSIGVDPLQALNGGLYYVRGKVELSAMTMNMLIRQKGHSITKDKRSDATICILHGKRADNGDTWVESFSLDDAKAANLLNSPTWKAYPKDMLFSRALSRLARQLFPDVIKGCYVEGEIAMDSAIHSEVEEKRAIPEITTIGSVKSEELNLSLAEFPEYRDQVFSYLNRQNLELADLSFDHAEKIELRIEKLKAEVEVVEEVSHG